MARPERADGGRIYNAARMSRDAALKLILLIVALSVLLSPFQRDLFVGDETKYAQVVREMRGGAFFLPTLDGVPFTHKPPFHFWIIDLLTYPLGVYSTWAFVLPSIIAFALLLWVLWRMEGPVAAFVCGTSLMVWGSAQTARMDVAFTALLAAAAAMLLRAFEEDRGAPLIAAGAITGIATLVKGPMAPVIMMALFLFEWLRRKERPSGGLVTALVLMIVIPLLWFVPAMLMGGATYTHEVLVKQTAGRAVGAWVHRSPPWFYLVRAPGTLFPWFFPAGVAIMAAWKRGDERGRFYINWILAVLVPYSILSSKLDVYMMAAIPPVALLIARVADTRERNEWGRWLRAANAFTISVLLVVGVAGLIVPQHGIKGPEAALAALGSVRALFVVLAVAAAVALIFTSRSRTPLTSTVWAGLVPLVALAYAAVAVMPIANDLASTRPLIRAITAQHAPPEEVALYWSPYLWARDMPRALERVRYVSPDSLQRLRPAVVVTSRAHAKEIAPSLAGMQRVESFRMIGKWFDVYRR